MARSPKPRSRNDKQRDPSRQGASKAAAGPGDTESRATGKRRSKEESYETWNKHDLYERARKIGIEGRSRMSKHELIAAIRAH